jgi:predicted phage-related endonuclease
MVHNLIKGPRGGVKASRERYMMQLLTERITGEPTEVFITKAMEWGTEWEESARVAFMYEIGLDVQECSFIPHRRIKNFGASPDGLINDPDTDISAVLEIKCPNSTTHLGIIAGKGIKSEWMYQVQAEMMCASVGLAYFVSYDPRMPGGLQLYIEEIPADMEMQARIEDDVNEFNKELDALEEKIREYSF